MLCKSRLTYCRQKRELNDSFSGKVQELNDVFEKQTGVDAMATWLREATAEKHAMSERMSNVLTTVYGDMVTNYITENRIRQQGTNNK